MDKLNECNRKVQGHNDGTIPYVANVVRESQMNQSFRTTFWTGGKMQMTLMSIPVAGDIGLEMHADTDQIIRVECGQGHIRMGKCSKHLNQQYRLEVGYTAFVPAGTWHNVINIGNTPLKLSSIYAPPHHKRETVHITKADVEH